MWKGLGKSARFRSVQRLKRANRFISWLGIVEDLSFFVIYSYLRQCIYVQQLKGMLTEVSERCTLRWLYKRGTLYVKNSMWKGIGLDLRVELSPGIKLGWLSTLSPWLPYIKLVIHSSFNWCRVYGENDLSFFTSLIKQKKASLLEWTIN